MDQDETQDFMEKLSSTENFKIFESKYVQVLINYLYEHIKKWTMYKLFYPYVFFLVTYVIYMNYIYTQFVSYGFAATSAEQQKEFIEGRIANPQPGDEIEKMKA